MIYPGFESFVAPARQDCAVWKTVAGLLLMAVIYAIGAFAVISAADAVFASISATDIAEAETQGAVLILLFHFIAMAIAAVVVTRLFHRRDWRTLFGDLGRLGPDFAGMLNIALFVAAASFALAMLTIDIDWKLDIAAWALVLPIAIPLILLQTGAEELVFRGYLLQQLGARYGVAARAAWMVIPSLIFAALHADLESQGANVWAVLAVITLFALVTADVTARTGSLGAAWALHFMVNTQALLLISVTGPLSGLSLGTVGMRVSDPEILPLFIVDAVALLITYVLWRRRYG